MKFRVTVDGEILEVEIEDSRARPIIAVVEGVRYSVEVVEETAVSGTLPVSPAPAAPIAAAGADDRRVLAPMPGVIVEIMVQAGDRVEPRQPLLVLESMKMKNVIRATTSAQVETVHVSAGQNVQHRDALVTYGR